MSAVRKPSLSDPLSLDGLEPLLDQIFAPSVQNEFAPGISTFNRTLDMQNNDANWQANTVNLHNHTANSQTAGVVRAIDATPVQPSFAPSEHADFYGNEGLISDATRNELLSKQLTELKRELQDFQFDYRHLQLELATKEDQLHYMPELFSKVLELSSMEAENAELKIENAALLKTIERLTPKPHEPSMGRRIINRFFGT
ncbi:MAG TPA: hypothetical protein V6C89_13910 [Drouetiella sp.]|jgi:hypothetical protein